MATTASRIFFPSRAARRRSAGAGRLPAIVLALATTIAGADPLDRPAKAVVVSVHGVIDDIMRDSIQRRVDQAQDSGAKVIIFELHTPGGAVTSALDICRMIKGIPGDIRTVAWVNSNAYSAGAMIAVACREIWMAPASAIGDCAPIMVAPTGGLQELGETERAKVESPILQEFRDSATRNGYDPLLSRAMVAVGEEVWWLERKDDPNERRFVTTAEKKSLLDDVAADDRVWKLVEQVHIPDADKTIDVTQPIDRENELLTMSQYDAIAFGFARGLAASLPVLAQKLELDATPAVLEKSGWEQFAMWLNSPVVRGALLVIVMIGAYIEFNSPGLILPGVTALIALAIFLAAPYAAGLADVWTIVLLVIGLVLLGIEIFVIPGFGIVGLLGLVLIALAILGSFVPTEPGTPPLSLPRLPGTWDALWTGTKVMTLSVLVSLVGMFLVAYYLPRARLARGVVSANPAAEVLSVPDPYASIAQVGDVGVVTGDLRPGGVARFGQDVVEVHSQGEYVPAGRRVQVIRREGLHIVVRPVSDDATA